MGVEMPLDPQVVELLESLEKAGGKPLEDCTPFEARQGDWSKDFIGALEDVAEVIHEFIPGPTADLPIRIYRPKGAGPLPAIVFFHGSAFTVSNISLSESAHRALSNSTGCIIVAVNYQKAPEHKFPTPFNDAYFSTQWVFENAERLGIDSRKIGVGGDSAGGNLAAAVALRSRDEQGPPLAFQLLIYPTVDSDSTRPSMQENATGYMLSAAACAWAWNQYIENPEDRKNPYAAPINSTNFSNLPPAIVLTAEYDPLRDEAEEYAQLLSDAGIQVIARRYEGMIHGFFWTAGVIAGSRKLIKDIGDDIRVFLG
jgi:acetyl esterase